MAGCVRACGFQWFASHHPRVLVALQVCDLTAWVEHHPGGYLALVNMAGKDATDNFTVYHPAYVWEKKLPYLVIGRLSPEEAKVTPFVKEFRDMNQYLLEKGACGLQVAACAALPAVACSCRLLAASCCRRPVRDRHAVLRWARRHDCRSVWRVSVPDTGVRGALRVAPP